MKSKEWCEFTQKLNKKVSKWIEHDEKSYKWWKKAITSKDYKEKPSLDLVFKWVVKMDAWVVLILQLISNICKSWYQFHMETKAILVHVSTYVLIFQYSSCFIKMR